MLIFYVSAENKTMVAAAAEPGERRELGRARLGVVANASKKKELQGFIKGNVEIGSTIISDGRKSDASLSAESCQHIVHSQKDAARSICKPTSTKMCSGLIEGKRRKGGCRSIVYWSVPCLLGQRPWANYAIASRNSNLSQGHIRIQGYWTALRHKSVSGYSYGFLRCLARDTAIRNQHRRMLKNIVSAVKEINIIAKIEINIVTLFTSYSPIP